jgi:hypothetical protein
MDAKEFMEAAVAAGLSIEFDNGKLVASPQNRVEIVPAQWEIKPVRQKDKTPSQRTSAASYARYKEALGEHQTAHLAAAVSVLIGVRRGSWHSTVDEVLQYARDEIDLGSLRECAVAATSAKHSVKVRGKTVSLSSSALTAAIYAALDSNPNLGMPEVRDILAAPAFSRVAKEWSAKAEEMGGVRSMESRRRSYDAFFKVLLGVEE